MRLMAEPNAENCSVTLLPARSSTARPSVLRAATDSLLPCPAFVIVTWAFVNAVASCSLDAPERSAANCNARNSSYDTPSERESFSVESTAFAAPVVKLVNVVAIVCTDEMKARPISMLRSVATSDAVRFAAYPSFCNSTTPALMPDAICWAFAESVNPSPIVAMSQPSRSFFICATTSRIWFGCFGACSSTGMKSAADGTLPRGQYGAKTALAIIPVCCQLSASGEYQRHQASHNENSRESIASISASVLPRWPARRSLNCSVGRAFIPPPAS